MVTTSHAPSPRKRQKGAFTRNFKKNYQYYLLLLPAVIWYAIFCYGPMYGVQIAFRNYNGALGMLGSPWVGLKHLVSFFESYYFGTLVKNTLAISLYSLAVSYTHLWRWLARGGRQWRHNPKFQSEFPSIHPSIICAYKRGAYR